MGYTPMAANPPKPTGISKILQDALATLTKNVRLILPILLVSILSSFLLFLGDFLTTRPLLVDLILKYVTSRNYKPDSPEFSNLRAAILKDLGELFADQIIFIMAAFFIQSLLQITTIYAITATYSGEFFTLKELLSKVKRGLKGPMITRVYAALINLGYLLILLTLAIVASLLLTVSIEFIILDIVLLLLALIFDIYLATVLQLSVVVSVAEEGCYGVDAIGRAMKLIKAKKKEAILITLLYNVIACAIYVAYNRMVAASAATHQVVAEFVLFALQTPLAFFVLSAFTVFYYECKKGHGEETIAIMAGDSVYASLPTSDAHVDKEIP